jgi:hypothetical protein
VGRVRYYLNKGKERVRESDKWMPATVGRPANNMGGQRLVAHTPNATTTAHCTLCYTLRWEGSEYASSCCEGRARCAAWLALLGRRMPASATRQDRFRRMLSCTFISCSSEKPRTESCEQASR